MDSRIEHFRGLARGCRAEAAFGNHPGSAPALNAMAAAYEAKAAQLERGERRRQRLRPAE